jgi:regulator of RNase E activity RraA
MIYNCKEDIIQLTPSWTGERLSDGRPNVKKSVIERLRNMSIEEVWRLGWINLYNNQFQGEFKQTHNTGKPTVGRAVTACFMPMREDLDIAMTRMGKAQGMKGMYNQWVVDSLIEDDVFVVDLFDKIEYGTIVGGNLATVIKQKTKHGGAVVWGSIRDLQQIRDIDDINIFYRGIHPAPIREVTMTGFNTPCRLGDAVCLPGDIVYACTSGVCIIPAQFAEAVADDGEKIHIRDIFGFQRIHEGKYNATEIDEFPWKLEMFEDFMDWFKTSEKAKNYQHLNFDIDREYIKKRIDIEHERYILGTTMKSVDQV